MQLGNLSDLIANISLAWLSSLCLFWSMSLIMVGNMRRSRSVTWFGWTFILTSFYFGTISISTGVMVSYMTADLISFARTVLLIDMIVKTYLTFWFIFRRRTRGTFIED